MRERPSPQMPRTPRKTVPTSPMLTCVYAAERPGHTPSERLGSSGMEGPLSQSARDHGSLPESHSS